MYTNIMELIEAPARPSVRLSYYSHFQPNLLYQDICAFANDYYQVGGGHIVIGVETDSDMVKRPVRGLFKEDVDHIIKQMTILNALIRPVIHPPYFIEQVDERMVVVLWIMAGRDVYVIREPLESEGEMYQTYIRQNAITLPVTDGQSVDLFRRHDPVSKEGMFIHERAIVLNGNATSCVNIRPVYYYNTFEYPHIQRFEKPENQ
jgi:ATP-dependent DNA helicase RecG